MKANFHMLSSLTDQANRITTYPIHLHGKSNGAHCNGSQVQAYVILDTVIETFLTTPLQNETKPFSPHSSFTDTSTI